jgi:hypothetical protein
MDTTREEQRYFLKALWQDEATEVSVEEFIRLERHCGFFGAGQGKGHPATAGFTSGFISGEIKRVDKNEWWKIGSSRGRVNVWRSSIGAIHIEACRRLYELLSTRDHKYSVHHHSKVVRLRDRELYLTKHPFIENWNNEGMYTLIGSLGVSSSVGMFIEKVTGLLADFPHQEIGDRNLDEMRAYAIRVWGFTETLEDARLGESIIVEFTDSNETYFVGGMTNFSGEGSSAWELVWTLLRHWSDVFGINIEYILRTQEEYAKFETEVIKLEQQQLEEEDKAHDEY